MKSKDVSFGDWWFFFSIDWKKYDASVTYLAKAIYLVNFHFII
jgi:hypothetical protein